MAPMHGERRKTQRITFVGLQDEVCDVESLETPDDPQIPAEHATATAAALAAAAAASKTGNGEGDSNSGKLLEASSSFVFGASGTDGGSARAPPVVGLELSATALESVAESLDEHACMEQGHGDPQEDPDMHAYVGVAAAIENVVRVKSWCEFTPRSSYITLCMQRQYGACHSSFSASF